MNIDILFSWSMLTLWFGQIANAMFLYNDPTKKSQRQYLRNTMPPAEIQLWAYLCRRRFLGLKFRRQYGVGPYVVDFYCPQLRLALEIDGDTHLAHGQSEYDQRRTDFLKSLDITVVRFLNGEVYDNVDEVLRKLKDVCATTPQPQRRRRGCCPPAAGGDRGGGKVFGPEGEIQLDI